jgi:hypothetical protein
MFIKLYKNNLFYKLNKYNFNVKKVKFFKFFIGIKNIHVNFK